MGFRFREQPTAAEATTTVLAEVAVEEEEEESGPGGPRKQDPPHGSTGVERRKLRAWCQAGETALGVDVQRAQEEAGEELRPRTLAGRHEGPSGQQEEWRLLNIEREPWGSWTERTEGNSVTQGDDSSVETLGLVWRGMEEIRTFRESPGLRVRRIAMGSHSYNEKMGPRGK